MKVGPWLTLGSWNFLWWVIDRSQFVCCFVRFELRGRLLVGVNLRFILIILVRSTYWRITDGGCGTILLIDILLFHLFWLLQIFEADEFIVSLIVLIIDLEWLYFFVLFDQVLKGVRTALLLTAFFEMAS